MARKLDLSELIDVLTEHFFEEFKKAIAQDKRFDNSRIEINKPHFIDFSKSYKTAYFSKAPFTYDGVEYELVVPEIHNIPPKWLRDPDVIADVKNNTICNIVIEKSYSEIMKSERKLGFIFVRNEN